MGFNTVALVNSERALSLRDSPYTLVEALCHAPSGSDSQGYWRRMVDREAANVCGLRRTRVN